MSASRLIALVFALLLVAGCGDDLETTYGARGIASVNGLDVLYARLDAAVPTTVFARLSPRAAERPLLIHVARSGGLPEADACAWISDWLDAEEGRQFVLVLRDGSLGPWLCRRWADEALAEAAKQPLKRAELEAAAARLVARGDREQLADDILAAPDTTQVCDLFSVHGQHIVAAKRLDGWWSGPAPLMMRLGAVPAALEAETLIAADGRPWAIAVPFGASRLVVVAGATALLDAAQVDHQARALTGALIAGVAEYGEPRRAAWIEHLVVRGDEKPKPPNILALLFGTPPFSWVAFHLLALVVVFLAWKATWLGRTEAPRDRRVERFARHVDALALHLRQARAMRAVVEAIARAVGHKPPTPMPQTMGEAFTAVQDLYRPEVRGRPPAQEPA